MTVRERIEANPLLDVAILSHGFAPHMRDYDLLMEAMWGEKEWGDAKGRYICRFTHCPEAHVVTSVGGETWRQSWVDTFIDYAEWEKRGEPEGYVWGVCWSMAYPGMSMSKIQSLPRDGRSDLVRTCTKRRLRQMRLPSDWSFMIFQSRR